MQNYCNLFFSKNNVDLYHYKHEDQLIDISQYKKHIVITAIAVGIFTLGIGGYLAARLLSTHYKWKQLQKVETSRPDLEKIQQIQEQTIPVLIPQCNPDHHGPLSNDNIKRLPLVETRGFPNAGSTCFIAASLQCLKNMTTFWKFLDADYALKKGESETDQHFSLREEIRTHLRNLLEKSNQGKTISKEEMLDFRKLLHAYDPQIPLQGFGGSSNVILAIFEILEIPGATYGFKNSKEDENFAEHYQDILINLYNKNTDSLSIQEGIDAAFRTLSSFNSPTELVSFSPLLCVSVQEHGLYEGKLSFKVEPNDHVTLKNHEGVEAKYKLTSLLQSPPGHYIAHLHDTGQPEWVIFNDANVSASSHLDDSIKNQIITLFYEKVED